MARHRTCSIIAGALLVLSAVVAHPATVQGAGLNTNVALTPPKGGTIVRTQWRYSMLSADPTPLGRDVDLSVQPITVVYGITENLAVLGTVPIIYRKIDFASGKSKKDTGVGDIPLLVKYRFYQKDEPGKTTRWAAIGGLEVPTYDEAFSSDSFDPIIGTVWTYQQRNWWLDWDVIYKFNTAGGIEGDDEILADIAYSHRLIGGESPEKGPWALYAIAEANGRYITDGSTEIFLSPGLQLITSQLILEAGVQLPVLEDLTSPRLEKDFTVVLSLRLAF